MENVAKISMYYYYDKHGRKKSLNKNYEDSKNIWLTKKGYKYSSLYCEYITENTYHVITVICATYNYKENTINVINRESV